VTDRPILMSAPMVLACLREVEHPGTGKTQTRRILKLGTLLEPKPEVWEAKKIGDGWYLVSDDPECGGRLGLWQQIRFHVGDRLWVKETWRTEARYDDRKPIDLPAGALASYEADYDDAPNDGCRGKNRVSIHMPRRFSRLTLTVTDVRVERLNSISEADAIAEGLQAQTAPNGHVTYHIPDLICGQTAARGYSLLWDHINGDGAWKRNDWVVAVTFKPERRNIDG
jgi:hypothetical protein